MKFPVWPVWSGVIAQISDWIGFHPLSEWILNTVGGRVVPIPLTDLNTSPFLLLVHHAHSFTPLDPVRAITKLILPEGFPAHPHSGFDTVTYCIDGGLRHRDSDGFQMSYGDGDAQWMRAGTGTIHEEMWDLKDYDWRHKRIELFQLWVNLPKTMKSSAPFVKLLKASDMETVHLSNGNSIKIVAGEIKVLMNEDKQNDSQGCGVYIRAEDCTDTSNLSEKRNGNIRGSPLHILHANIPGSNGVLDFNTESTNTVFVYVRTGSLLLSSPLSSDKKEIRRGDCVSYRMPKDTRDISQVQLKAGTKGFDGLVLIGKPIEEPVYMRGPFVECDEEDMRKSSQVFNAIGEKAFWDYRISDEEWKNHCDKLQLQQVIQFLRKQLG